MVQVPLVTQIPRLELIHTYLDVYNRNSKSIVKPQLDGVVGAQSTVVLDMSEGYILVLDLVEPINNVRP